METKDKREYFRYKTLARARIKGKLDEETLLKDLSITGCCITSKNNSDVFLNVQYELEVIPEEDAKIHPFMLLVEAKWTCEKENSCDIGLKIVKSPKGKKFLRYVDYLSWRYSQGNSMTNDNTIEIPFVI